MNEIRDYFLEAAEERRTKQPPFVPALGPFSPFPNETMEQAIVRHTTAKEEK